MSLFVFPYNYTIQVLLKNNILYISIKQHLKKYKNISRDTISIINLFLLGSIWFTIYYFINRPLYMYKIFQPTKQNMNVQVN